MSDIVDELRDTEDLGSPGTDFDYMVDLLHKAADDIEKLRRAVNKMAVAAGPSWTPGWLFDAPWFDG